MRTTIRAIAVTALFLSAATGSREAAAAEGWSYEAIPFLWAAGIEGRQGFDGQVSDVDADFGDLVEFVDTGVAARLRASKAPFGWFAEASNVNLSHEVATSGGELGIKSEQSLLEAGISYEFSPGFAAYGGARYQRVKLGLRLDEMRIDRDKGWIDAIAGVSWTRELTGNWVLWARADIGAGSSDFIWLGEFGGGYRFGTRWGAYAAYRVLDTDYTSSGFVYDIRQSGLMLGFGIRF